MARYLLGGAFIVIGTLWLFNNLGLTQIALGPLIGTYWPLLLILRGVSLMQEDKKGVFSGVIWLALGLGLLGRNLGLYEFDLTLIWRVLLPILLVHLGWQIIKAAGAKNARWAIMGAVELKDEGWPLTSDSFIAFMGGFDLDLTAASIPAGETVLHLIAIMGAWMSKYLPTCTSNVKERPSWAASTSSRTAQAASSRLGNGLGRGLMGLLPCGFTVKPSWAGSKSTALTKQQNNPEGVQKSTEEFAGSWRRMS